MIISYYLFLFDWPLLIISVLENHSTNVPFWLFLFDWTLILVSVLRTRVSLFFFCCSYLINLGMIIICWEPHYHYSFLFFLFGYFYCSFLTVPVWSTTYDYLCFGEPQYKCSFLIVPIWLTTYSCICFENQSIIVLFVLFLFD